jgi:hypothetical protein
LIQIGNRKRLLKKTISALQNRPLIGLIIPLRRNNNHVGLLWGALHIPTHLKPIRDLIAICVEQPEIKEHEVRLLSRKNLLNRSAKIGQYRRLMAALPYNVCDNSRLRRGILNNENSGSSFHAILSISLSSDSL